MTNSRFGVSLPLNSETLQYLKESLEENPQWLMYAVDEILCVLKKSYVYNKDHLEFMLRAIKSYIKESCYLRKKTKHKKVRKILKLRVKVFESFQAYLEYLSHLRRHG